MLYLIIINVKQFLNYLMEVYVALDVSAISEEIRFLLGGLSITIMPDVTLNKIVQRNIEKYGDVDENLCIVTYKSLLDTLQYLINAQAAGSAGSGGGSVLSIEEEIGKRRIKKTFSDGSNGTETGWEGLYAKYVSDPSLVCQSLVPEGGSGSGLVIIGGTSQTQYDKVNSNPDTRNGWSATRLCWVSSRRSKF
ncbi:hypothetical protein S140_130 [Shewanella sp. phage 1/40]|uniref:hypothetical protein n=1 Tax=Shewanella sp. phage 1/40 TaxID=1458860 RepID=UPI0004F8C5C3|nr:hypothetical protein S140_130 [Shewanella sp. phage 1/40]AHK11537.1 hypothetical protein S140_130 [Shewanella sp. phage 1/40]